MLSTTFLTATLSFIPHNIRERYEASPNSIFGWKTLDDDQVHTLRQSVAEDLAYLVDRYRRNKAHNSRSTYLMLVKVFEQQCQVEGDRVQVRDKTGGNIVCNPSDPDATLGGHKGSGYQVQLSETCNPDNDVQLILSAIPETACQSDSASLRDAVEDLRERGFLPSQMLADTAYGSDENYCHCREEGIDLVSPTAGKCPENQIDPQMLTVADFQIGMGTNIRANGEVEIHPHCLVCPGGVVPHRSHYDHDAGQIRVLQHPHICQACPLSDRCPHEWYFGIRAVTIHPKQVRLIERRRQ